MTISPRPQQAYRRAPEPSPLCPDCAGFTVNKIHFQGISDYFRASRVDINHEECAFCTLQKVTSSPGITYNSLLEFKGFSDAGLGTNVAVCLKW